MKLHAKIFPKYLQEILDNEKKTEVRQIREIELDDGKRTATILVEEISKVPAHREKIIRDIYPDVPWVIGRPMHEIKLGRIIGLSNNEPQPEDPYAELQKQRELYDSLFDLAEQGRKRIESLEAEIKKLKEQNENHEGD